MEHTDDCEGGEVCTPREGVWDQPDGYYVKQVEEDGWPWAWCVIREVAMDLQLADAG